MEVFIDADFAGNWNSKESEDGDPARSRHRCIVAYEGLPIIRKSQLQTDIASYITEIEYTGLLYSLQDAIMIIELQKELK